HLITSEIWYRLLNCGFRLPAGAGTDAFPNFASLRGPPGLVRVFVQAGARLNARAFLAGLKAGRTFVSNAPLLEFTLDGRQVGAEIRLPRGGGTLTARVRLRSSVPVDHLEIIGNGRVVAAIPLTGDRTQASATVAIAVAGSGGATEESGGTSCRSSRTSGRRPASPSMRRKIPAPWRASVSETATAPPAGSTPYTSQNTPSFRSAATRVDPYARVRTASSVAGNESGGGSNSSRSEIA